MSTGGASAAAEADMAEMDARVELSMLPIPTVYTGKACANCMEIAQELCSRCKRVPYCNRECQVADWKQHKHECKILSKVRLDYHNLLKKYVLASKLEHNHSTAILGTRIEDVVEGMCKNQDLPMSLLGKKNNTFIQRAGKFVRGTKICVWCKRNEYDFEDPKYDGWISCPTCHFGWCCSAEHFEEAPHSPELCAGYVQAIKLAKFSWAHVKKYNDILISVPSNLRSAPMKKFPASWEDYFKLREPSLHKMTKAGRLPDEYLKVATEQLSQPVSCLNAMYVHDSKHFKSKQTLTIHVLGPETTFELWPTHVWEEIMHCLPAAHYMSVVFVGPHACEGIDPPQESFPLKEVECCPGCTANSRKRANAFFAMPYHEYQAKQASFATPDLIVAFNTGMHEVDKRSWRKTLNVILDMDVPAMFTSYNLEEATKDLSILRDCEAKMVTESPVLNPFRSEDLKHEPGFCFNSGMTPFFQNSMYYLCFQGRS